MEKNSSNWKIWFIYPVETTILMDGNGETPIFHVKKMVHHPIETTILLFNSGCWIGSRLVNFHLMILLMVQKSGDHQLIWQISQYLQGWKHIPKWSWYGKWIPWFTRFQIHPNGGCAGFLNHQQHEGLNFWGFSIPLQLHSEDFFSVSVWLP